MIVIASTFEPSGANANKSNTITMLGIHVRVNFKNKSAKFIFFRFNDTERCLTRNRWWCDSNKSIQQFLHAEIIHSTAKKYGSHFPAKVIFNIKIRINSLNQFYICTKLSRVVIADILL